MLHLVHQLTNILCGPFEEEHFVWDSQIGGEPYTIHVSEMQDESVVTLVKVCHGHNRGHHAWFPTQVFAAGMDVLERLLTGSRGHYLIPAQPFLHLLIRVLSLNSSLLEKHIGSPKSFELLACFPGLQAMCWDAIHLLMRILGNMLLPGICIVADIIVAVLKDTKQPAVVKVALHKAATEYVRITGCAVIVVPRVTVCCIVQGCMVFPSFGQVWASSPELQ